LKYLNFFAGKLEKIGSFAFYNLNSLTLLGLGYNLIDLIPTNAFHFRKESKDVLDIYLDNNPNINGSSFQINAFENIGRTVNLKLYFINSVIQKITFLDENVFTSFLEANQNNRIYMTNNLIDCSDCRSYWLKQNHYLASKIYNLMCSNKNSFLDNSNFLTCK